jgi:uncharacterized membrane protein YhaH (DUF805 family)
MSEASISDINPYDAPDASLDTGHDEESYQPKIFSFSGRIGRMRYLAYNVGANLVMLAALIPLSGGMAVLRQCLILVPLSASFILSPI